MIDQNILMQKIGAWIKPRFLKFEKNFVAIAFLTFIINIVLPDFSFLFIISLIGLSLLYYFNSFSPLDKDYESGFNNFLKYISNWTYSTLTIGLLFTIQRFPGSSFMVTVSGIAIIIIVLISIYLMLNSTIESKVYKIGLLRPLIFGLIALVFIITPRAELIKNKVIKKIEVIETPK